MATDTGPIWKHHNKTKGSYRSKWARFRKQYLKVHAREGGWYVCNHCGIWMQYPEVDHVIKRSVAPDRVFDETNLQILCHDCHVEKDGGMKTAQRSGRPI